MKHPLSLTPHLSLFRTLPLSAVGRGWMTFFYQTQYYFRYTPQSSQGFGTCEQCVDYRLLLRKAGVTTFFLQNMIDMPIVLKKSKSLFSTTFRYPQLRLLNLLMRHGERRLVSSRWAQAEQSSLFS